MISGLKNTYESSEQSNELINQHLWSKSITSIQVSANTLLRSRDSRVHPPSPQSVLGIMRTKLHEELN